MGMNMILGNPLSIIQLDKVMSSIGIYDYHLQDDLPDLLAIRDRRRIPADYYCSLDKSQYDQGASVYMINSVYVDKKSNPPGPVIKNTVNMCNSQVIFTPHSIQRYIERGNTMPKLSELHQKLPMCWHYPEDVVSDSVLLPQANGAFLGDLIWTPNTVYETYTCRSKNGMILHYSSSSFSETLSKNNLEQHHRYANHYQDGRVVMGWHRLVFHAHTYIDYDQMHSDQQLIYDTHFYDPVASWDLQLDNMSSLL